MASLTSVAGTFWRVVVLPSEWSLLLAATGLVGWWMVGQRQRTGWLVNIVTQFLFGAYGLAEHQYGFLLTATVLGSVFVRGWLRWGGDRAARVEHAARAVLAAPDDRDRLADLAQALESR